MIVLSIIYLTWLFSCKLYFSWAIYRFFSFIWTFGPLIWFLKSVKDNHWKGIQMHINFDFLKTSLPWQQYHILSCVLADFHEAVGQAVTQKWLSSGPDSSGRVWAHQWHSRRDLGCLHRIWYSLQGRRSIPEHFQMSSSGGWSACTTDLHRDWGIRSYPGDICLCNKLYSTLQYSIVIPIATANLDNCSYRYLSLAVFDSQTKLFSNTWVFFFYIDFRSSRSVILNWVKQSNSCVSNDMTAFFCLTVTLS